MTEMTPEEFWATYLLNRKNDYLVSYRQDIGIEYNSNAAWWDSLAEREWLVIQDRLSAGFGVTQAIKQQLGEDFFERNLLEEHNIVDSDFVEYEIEGESHKLYTISDFLMLSNQGIFRDTKFVLDHTGKWRKNVIKELSSYGFNYLESYKRNMLVMVIQ